MHPECASTSPTGALTASATSADLHRMAPDPLVRPRELAAGRSLVGLIDDSEADLSVRLSHGLAPPPVWYSRQVGTAGRDRS